MKKTVLAIAVLGVASVALWRSRPAITTGARQKCEEMMERMTGAGARAQGPSCGEGSCASSAGTD